MHSHWHHKLLLAAGGSINPHKPPQAWYNPAQLLAVPTTDRLAVSLRRACRECVAEPLAKIATPQISACDFSLGSWFEHQKALVGSVAVTVELFIAADDLISCTGWQ